MDFKRVEDLTPYTEPDLEQVKREVYEQGLNDANYAIADDSYKKGLSDAGECARKIFCTSHGELERIFDLEEDDNGLLWVYHEYTASEAIEKIRQYEQGEQFQVGDEFEIESGNRQVY